MGRPMDYDSYAHEYADTRWPFPWILEPLERCVTGTAKGSSILEVGCGTGDYVNALADRFPDRTFHGFDLSMDMLRVAQSRSRIVAFSQCNAEGHFPYDRESFDLVFLLDVIHHITNLLNLFAESARVLKRAGSLVIVTDSEQNIRNRSLTRFFPELLELELERYPRIEELHEAARTTGLTFKGSKPAEGYIDLDDGFISKLERKASSSMRLMSSEAHARGIQKVRGASRRGEKWLSCYTVLRYNRSAECRS